MSDAVVYQFHLPIKVQYGMNAIDSLSDVLREFDSKRMFVVTDRGVVGAGLLAKIRTLLEDLTIEIAVYDEVAPNPSDTTVMLGVDRYRAFTPDVVMGLGGGSSIDAAKAIRAVAQTGGIINDYEGFDRFGVSAEIPLIAVPTTAGTGSEMGGWAVVTDTKRHFKMGFGDPPALAPTISIIDPALTVTLPPELTAATGMDAFSHALEVYLSTASSPITDALALRAIELVAKNIGTAYKNGEDLKARENMMYGSMIAGMAMSNADCGAIHAIAETVGGIYDIGHGVSIASFTPHVMKFNTIAIPEKMANVARAMGVDISGASTKDAANSAWQAAAQIMSDLSLPRPSELGIDRDDEELLHRIAHLSTTNMSSGGNPRPVSKEDYYVILKEALTEHLW
jgi:alcohol dehydrogenase class IV